MNTAAALTTTKLKLRNGILRPLRSGTTDTQKLEGLQWMAKAAHQGNAEAQLTLGVTLWTLLRDEDDIREGLKWLDAARKQGLPEAQEIYEGVCQKYPAFCGVRAS